VGAPGEALDLPDRTRVRLAPGGHDSPREGVCVVELASLIAREEFSDRPRCVCPVIAAFLRGWNDRAAHAERQRLAPYAKLIVGSRGDRETTRRRREICLEWAGADLRRGGVGAVLSMVAVKARIATFCGVGAAIRPDEGAADYAARVAMSRRDTDAAFALLDSLLAVGGRLVPKIDAAANGHDVGTVNGHQDPTALNGRGANGDARRVNGNGAPYPSNGNGSANGGMSGSKERATTGVQTRE
jgi:hypothetical protein